MERNNSTKRNGFISNHLPVEAGYNLSWGSIIAGVITFLAVFMLLSLITSAIGLGGFDPTSRNPVKGVGTGMAIWTVISLLISLFAGGFVAGLAARRTGLLHGFLTWALSVILVFWLITSTALGAVSSIGKAIGSISGAVTSSQTKVIVEGEKESDDIITNIGNKIDELDTKALSEDTQNILRDTEVDELQPEYLNQQLKEAKDEILSAGKAIVMEPQNADQIISDLGDDLQGRIDHISENVDRDALKNAVAKNTDLSEAEADQAVDNAIEELETAKVKASEQIEQAKVSIEEAKIEVEEKIEEGKEVADEVTNKGSAASIVLFIGLIIGAILTSYAGIVGSKYTKNTVIEQ